MNDPTSSIRVWDAPLRVFHWLFALCFAGAYLTSEGERWRLVHVSLGYTLAGLVAFRLVWGVVGSRHARFANFVRGPRAAWAYLRDAVHGRAAHYTGHNPAGALAIVALLALAALTAALGWATYAELGGEWLADAHALAGNLMLAVVLVHLAGVAFGSWLHRENLPRSMVTGRKRGAPGEAGAQSHPLLAAALLVAVLGFWWLQWQNAPAPADRPPAAQPDSDDD